MSLEKVAQALPNGLHDAELLALTVNYADGSVAMDMRADWSDLSGESEVSTPIRLLFTGVRFLTIDPPSTDMPLGVSMIDGGDGDPATVPLHVAPRIDGGFLCWIFLERTNSFIRLSAADVRLDGVDG